MEVISCCGCVCSDCPQYPEHCAGCPNVEGKAYWLAYTDEEVCGIYNCCVKDKKYAHCGNCKELPCIHYDGEDPTKSKEENLADHIKQLEQLKKLREKTMKFDNLKWMKESTFEKTEQGIAVYAPASSDYFVDAQTDEVINTAPFLYEEVCGDFVLKAKVHHDFISTYDACVLLALDNEALWAKACFEFSDLGTHSIVSVMTNKKSDDANNVSIEGNEVWLQLARKGNMFAIHYSLDGQTFKMARLTYLPMSETIKVGFEAQSPMGEGGMRYFEHCSLEHVTLNDIRDGNR